MGARPPLSVAHGTSLATTSGITAIISLVAAGSFVAQATPAQLTTELSIVLAIATVSLIFLGACGLYEARNAVGRSLDLFGADPAASAQHGARGLLIYHLAMGAVFAGLATGAAWRLALPLGPRGWIAVFVAAVLAIRSWRNAARA